MYTLKMAESFATNKEERERYLANYACFVSCSYVAMYMYTKSRLTIVSHEAKKQQVREDKVNGFYM